jgi:hypothetical protein
MLSVVILNVVNNPFILSVIILSVIMQSVVVPLHPELTVLVCLAWSLLLECSGVRVTNISHKY